MYFGLALFLFEAGEFEGVDLWFFIFDMDEKSDNEEDGGRNKLPLVVPNEQILDDLLG